MTATDTELTAMVLNNTLVSMRPIVKQAEVRFVRKLDRQAATIKKNKSTNEEAIAKNERRHDRLIERITAVKQLGVNDVAKLALINVKSKEELNKNKSASEQEKSLYWLATCPPIVKFVDEFRAKYPSWPTNLPFLLQRLGQQYRDKQSFTGEKQIPGEYSGKNEKVEKKKKNDVKSIVQDTIVETAKATKASQPKKARNPEAKKEKVGVKTPKVVLPKKEVPKSTPAINAEPSVAVIRRFNLDDMFTDDVLPMDKPTKMKKKVVKRKVEVEKIGSDDEIDFTAPSTTMQLQVATEKKFGEALANDTFFKHATVLKPKAPRHLAAKLSAIEDNNPTPLDDAQDWGASRRGGQKRSTNQPRGPPPPKRQTPSSGSSAKEGTAKEHPSWAAKRAMKDGQKKVKPMGTRITFDD